LLWGYILFFQQPFETATTIPINTTTKNQLKHPKNTQIRVSASQIVTTILTAISTTASTTTAASTMTTSTTTTHSNNNSNNCCFNLRCNHPHLCVSPLRNDDRSSYANCQSTSIQLSKQINIHFLQDLSFFYNCLFVCFLRKEEDEKCIFAFTEVFNEDMSPTFSFVLSIFFSLLLFVECILRNRGKFSDN